MPKENPRVPCYSHLAVATLSAISGLSTASAQDEVFDLGRMNVITVIGEVDDADTTDNTVTIEDVWTFNRNTLDEAIKHEIPSREIFRNRFNRVE